MQGNEDLLHSELIIDATAEQHLKEIAVWGKFLSILGFIISGIFTFAAIFAGTIINHILSKTSNASSTTSLTGTIIMTIYLVFSIITGILSVYLFQFSIKMPLAIKNNDQNALNNSFKALKAYYRFAGIISIIYLASIFIGILGVLLTITYINK